MKRKKIGQLVKEARKDKGLTQAQLAEIIQEQTGKHITASAIGQFERSNSLTLNTITKISNALNISSSYFTPREKSDELAEELADKYSDLIYDAFKKAPGEIISVPGMSEPMRDITKRHMLNSLFYEYYKVILKSVENILGVEVYDDESEN